MPIKGMKEREQVKKKKKKNITVHKGGPFLRGRLREGWTILFS